MATLIYSADNLAVTTTLKSTENSTDYPASNVTSITWPWRRWQATTAGTGEWVGLDLGSATSIKAVMIDHCNFTSATIDADTAATFDSNAGAPAYTSGAQAVSQDGVDGRYKLFFTLNQTYRYIRVVSGGTLTDGLVAYVGSFSAWGSYVTFGANPAFPYDVEVVEPTVAAGGGEPVSVGHTYANLIFNSTNYPDSTGMRAQLLTLARNGRATPLVMWRNAGDTSEAYIVRRSSAVTISLNTVGSNRFSRMTFREVGELLT